MYDTTREKERDKKLEVCLRSFEQKIDGHLMSLDGRLTSMDGRLMSMEKEVHGVSKSVAELKGSMDMLLSVIRKSGV